MSYGPRPWLQKNWDARAAWNFIGGGAGCGLVLAAFALGAGPALRPAALAVAAALVIVGLLAVWAEIGRPLRALNVYRNARTSWMTREALVAPLLLGTLALAAAGVAGAWLAAPVLAASYLYCQARILLAAKGIPTWREPLSGWLLALCGLSEGAGALAVLGAWAGPDALAGGRTGMSAALVVLCLLRLGLALAWVQHFRTRLARAPGRAAEGAGRTLAIGSAVAVLPVLAVIPAPGWQDAALLLGGVIAAGTGVGFKLALITRAAFNQGFALPHAPVRGARR